MKQLSKDDRLARAKKYLAIAESKDAKREAYKLAAQEIRAYKDETKATWAAIAIAVGRGDSTIRAIVRWAEGGHKAETPFLADGKATGRAEASHLKKVFRERPIEEIKEILDDLPDEVVEKVAQATEGTKVTRRLYPDRIKPTHKEASRRQKAKDVARLKKNPLEASMRLGSTMGSARAAIRVLVQGYQDFLAIVDDEEILADARENLLTLRADIDLALGEVLDGSIEEAFSKLLDEKEVR